MSAQGSPPWLGPLSSAPAPLEGAPGSSGGPSTPAAERPAHGDRPAHWAPSPRLGWLEPPPPPNFTIDHPGAASGGGTTPRRPRADTRRAWCGGRAARPSRRRALMSCTCRAIGSTCFGAPHQPRSPYLRTPKPNPPETRTLGDCATATSPTRPSSHPSPTTCGSPRPRTSSVLKVPACAMVAHSTTSLFPALVRASLLGVRLSAPVSATVPAPISTPVSQGGARDMERYQRAVRHLRARARSDHTSRWRPT